MYNIHTRSASLQENFDSEKGPLAIIHPHRLTSSTLLTLNLGRNLSFAS
ncbi:MAG: hypothetical protein HQL31_10270 [Planctomycetes bacterium]|nr:hypothetical protein [Planctomycetota bacterium]